MGPPSICPLSRTELSAAIFVGRLVRSGCSLRAIREIDDESIRGGNYRNHAADRAGRWRGSKRLTEENCWQQRGLDSNHDRLGTGGNGGGLLRWHDQRRPLESRSDDWFRRDRPICLDEGSHVPRRTNDWSFSGSGGRVAGLFPSLGSDRG